MTYPEVLDYMFKQLPMFHRVGPAAYKPSLDNTIALLKLVGNPEKDLRTIHIAGTNGKGSTSNMIASALQEAGYKTGLYTSPHLVDFRERVRINGVMIPESDVVHFVESFGAQWESIQPSFFEMTVALCFWYFKKEKVDIAVIEVGLGGRLDSTNVITPEVSVITNIGLDHMNLLGNTIDEIASEKAGIIKANIPLVIGPMRPAAQLVMEQKAAEMGALSFYANLCTDAPEAALKGLYQEENRKTACTSLRVLRDEKQWTLEESHIQAGFKNVLVNTGLQGRWQVINQSPLAIADVAHNQDGLSMVLRQISQTPHDHLHFVLGMVADKDISIVLELLPKSATYYFCKANIPRGMNEEELKEKASLFSLEGKTYPNIRSAYESALAQAKTNDLVFVGGSIFTVAEVL